MIKLWRALAVVVVVAAGTITLSATEAAAAPGWHEGRCTAADPNSVTVVVDFQQLGGDPVVRCAFGLPQGARGSAALAAAQIPVAGVGQDNGAFVCRLAGRPRADEVIPVAGGPGYTETCQNTPPAAAYWSYWSAAEGKGWDYSTLGVQTNRVHFGGYEGWSFAVNASEQSNPRPRVCAGAGFSDVPATSSFCADIEWLARTGISTGTAVPPPALPLFKPAEPVSRQAMAAFLFRFAQPGQALPTCAGPSRFADVDRGSPFCGAIEWLAAQGITTGAVDGAGRLVFNPASPVSRQAMAAFLHRFTQPGEPPACVAGSGFADVTTAHQFCGAISWLAAAGISTGTPAPPGAPLFKPADPVSRQAMAAFLHRVEIAGLLT